MAASLAAGWVHEGDFLLAHDTATYDAVVGNPPYVRIEQLAPALQQEYRRRFSSITTAPICMSRSSSMA